MRAQRPTYKGRARQDSPVRLLLLLGQQVAQMEQRPPVTLILVAGDDAQADASMKSSIAPLEQHTSQE
jgi:hypothetical protein